MSGLYILSGSHLKQQAERFEKMDSVTATVIIPTHNRSDALKRALHSLSKQTMSQERFELIVVNDGSSDETPDVCERFREKIKNLELISHRHSKGAWVSRNAGIARSRGRLVLFTDDDCVAAGNWIERMTSVLERHPIVAGAIWDYGTNPVQFCHNISQFHPFLRGRKSGEREFLAGANMGFQKPVLEMLEGFSTNQRLAMDMDMAIRARIRGYRIHFDSEARVFHNPGRIRLGKILRYSATHARSTIKIRNQYKTFLHTPIILRSVFPLFLFSPLIALKVVFDIYRNNKELLKFSWSIPLVYALKMAWCIGASRGLLELEN